MHNAVVKLEKGAAALFCTLVDYYSMELLEVLQDHSSTRTG